MLNKLTIHGFKSIRELEELELKNLNVFIGSNGAGKSNFIQVFRMLMAMSQKGFQKYIKSTGDTEGYLHEGPKHTKEIRAEMEFTSLSPNAKGSNFYRFTLTPTVDQDFLVEEERKYHDHNWRSYGSPSNESRLRDEKNEKSWDGQWNGVGHFVYESISSWMVYHFHDTSDMSPMRSSEIVEDHKRLRSDAKNIAPLLLHFKDHPLFDENYKEIVNAVRVALPYFDDFSLNVEKKGQAEKVKLGWTQKGSDYPMQPYHLSDGSIRFICLATALLQPNPPSVILIDEPELGLHPEAISLLAELIQNAATRTQVIIATQSPSLLSEFSVDDVVVVNRENGQSVFKRLNKKDYSEWLKDYTVGELWTKNVIQGGTKHE